MEIYADIVDFMGFDCWAYLYGNLFIRVLLLRSIILDPLAKLIRAPADQLLSEC